MSRALHGFRRRHALRLLGLLFTFRACTLLLAGEHSSGQHAEYIGGTRPDIPLHSQGLIATLDQRYFTFVSRHTEVRIPYQRINLLEYGQDVDRRYLTAALISPLLLMAKKRTHFLTIGFMDDDGQQQALVFKVDKRDIRVALVGLEARTGQQVQFQDEDARKAGRG